jgi:hypothetical protein
VTTSPPEVRQSGSGKVRMAPGWGVAGWLLGIFGAISLFLGLFVMFGNESSSIGIGGDLSWQVSEVTDAWMYGLLIGGGLALLLALSIVLFAPRQEVTDASALSDLLWHTGAFIVVNAFIWIQDIAIGGGVDYAYWITIPWGIGLTVHALMFYRNHRRDGPRHLGEPQPH